LRQFHEQVALAAKHIGLSLAHPAVTRLAGCRKTRLHVLHRSLLTRTARILRKAYPDDPPDSVVTLALMTVSEMARLSFERNPWKANLAPLLENRENA